MAQFIKNISYLFGIRGSLRINFSKFVRIEMAKSTKGTTKSKAKSKPESFIWKDDEVKVLLKVTEEVRQTAENVDWESCQSKYSDILELFMSQYPSAENAKSIGKDFPHKKEEMTKIIITTKLKAVRSKFRAAVDSGRKSGHGRVVILLYFESCRLYEEDLLLHQPYMLELSLPTLQKK